MELGIDSSTRHALVSLSREGTVVAELAWRSERNHSIELVPAIRRLMDHAAVNMIEIKAIFVAKGPGSFSALRVGVSTAKGLAVASGIPLISIGTLDVEAEPYLGLGLPVRALIEAGRDRLYAGTYSATASTDDPLLECITYDDLATMDECSSLFCGEAAHAVTDIIKQRLGGQARVVDIPPPTRRASVLAKLGSNRWLAGMIDDPATLQPIYLRSAQVNVARQTWAGA